MTLIRSAQSLEYVRVPVSTTNAQDPTPDPVGIAFLDRFTYPGASTVYISGTWEADTSDPSNPIYYARLLVGPGGPYEPTAGTSMVIWIKVTDNPEVPVIRSGNIQFV